MGILDKVYKKASGILLKEYLRQMWILSGDIVINTSVKSYSTYVEAEAALNDLNVVRKASREVI